MADRKQPIKTALCKRGADKTRHFPHFQPLSIYSDMVFCKATNSCSVSPSCSPGGRSWNLKVELSNSKASVGRKRRLGDSCLDETYDTPLKKKTRLAPESACVRDSSSTYRQVTLVSSQSSSVPDGIKRIEKTLSDEISSGLDCFNCRDKTAGESSRSLTDVHSSSPVMMRNKNRVDVFAFDYDVDEILSLSPIKSADVSADGLENFIQSCRTHDKERLSVEKGHSLWSSSKRKQSKECSLGQYAQHGSDEGYVTKSYFTSDSYKMTVLNLSNDKTPPVSVPFMSTPLTRCKELAKRCTKLSPGLDLGKQSWNSEPVKTSSASSPNAYVNLDAGKTEAPPTSPFLNVHKSKEVNIMLEGTSSHKSTVSRNQEEEDVLSVSQQHADSAIQVTFGEETDAADSFESTLPLQVQVKSKVVLPNTLHPKAGQAAARQQPEKKAASEGRGNVFKDVPRPVVLYRDKDWEREKKAYVDSVTRHMADNAGDGVMTELMHLMDAVANQGRGSDGRKWQHPSDLSRRNYRLRNSGRSLSLDEWQNLNYRYHRRFAKVPQMFKRSPVL